MARRRQRNMKRRGRGVLGKLRRHKKKVIAAIALPAAAYAAYRNPAAISSAAGRAAFLRDAATSAARSGVQSARVRLWRR